MQKEASIADQQRWCRDAAARDGLAIVPDLEFSDSAISGTKLDRDGLNAMLQSAKDERFTTLFVYSLSRLARESVITMPMLKQLVYVNKVRVVSVTEGIDSARDGWEMVATIFSMISERYIKDLSLSVFRGQEGAVLAGYSVGDYCYGYDSQPVLGSEQSRKGRNAKPRMEYVIDETTASCVVRIFHWFVRERRSIRWITIKLNALGAPKDHRSTTKDWNHQYVARLLGNEKYIGIWPWGLTKNVRNPLDGKVHKEERPEEESEQWTRQLPHLRLIDNDTWNAAQRILDENAKRVEHRRKAKGKFGGSRTGNEASHPSHLLSRLVQCESCQALLQVGGSNGTYLHCPNYPRGVCQCKTQLRRNLAEKLILDAIGTLIIADEKWKLAILDELDFEWKRQTQNQPDDIERLEKAHADTVRKIERLLDLVEGGDNSPDIRQRLQERRREKEALTKELRQAQESPSPAATEPTLEWVENQLQDLHTVLKSPTPAAVWALRNLLDGKIVVREIREPGRKRSFLQGRFTITLPKVIESLKKAPSSPDQIRFVTQEEVPTTEAAGVTSAPLELVIDFRIPPQLDAKANQAKELYDQGLLNFQIAGKLGCGLNQVTDLLQHWHKSRGLTMPDGRRHRHTLQRKETGSALYEVLADEAKALWDQGLADLQIAIQLGCSPPTAVAAVAHWYGFRGQTMPTHADRRLALMDRMVSLYDQNLPISEVAGQVGICTRSVTLLLRERLQQLGRTMVDGRSRRGRKDKIPNRRSHRSRARETPSTVSEQQPNDDQSLPPSPEKAVQIPDSCPSIP